MSETKPTSSSLQGSVSDRVYIGYRARVMTPSHLSDPHVHVPWVSAPTRGACGRTRTYDLLRVEEAISPLIYTRVVYRRGIEPRNHPRSKRGGRHPPAGTWCSVQGSNLSFEVRSPEAGSTGQCICASKRTRTSVLGFGGPRPIRWTMEAFCHYT